MLGLVTLPWWGYLLVMLGFGQISVFAITLYLHRCQAHRALSLHPIVSHFFRFWLWLTTAIVTKEWTAVHRKHHARVETAEDPHSPIVYGIKKVFLEGSELYRKEALNLETLQRYGDGTPDDWMERQVYTKYSYLGIVLMLIIDLIVFGTIGLTIWAVQMAWSPLFAAGVINGMGHYLGYRNFETEDASRNILPFGLFMGGEELHNNHHAFGTSAKFATKWWEIDSGWLAIRLLQCVGLAHPKRVVPGLTKEMNKHVIDADTLAAVITHRFQLMARYSREVIAPALREEKRRASKASSGLLTRAKKVLVRDAFLLQAKHQVRLAQLLENFQSLKVVYQFRLQLQDIWSRSTASQKELLEALQDWCERAEVSGIEALRRFALQLKMYVPQRIAS